MLTNGWIDSRCGMRFVTRLRKIAFNSVNRDGFAIRMSGFEGLCGLIQFAVGAKNEAGALVETNAPTTDSYSSVKKK